MASILFGQGTAGGGSYHIDQDGGLYSIKDGSGNVVGSNVSTDLGFIQNQFKNYVQSDGGLGDYSEPKPTSWF